MWACLIPRGRSLVKRDALWVMGLIVAVRKALWDWCKQKVSASEPSLLPSLFSRHTAFYRKVPGDRAECDLHLADLAFASWPWQHKNWGTDVRRGGEGTAFSITSNPPPPLLSLFSLTLIFSHPRIAKVDCLWIDHTYSRQKKCYFHRLIKYVYCWPTKRATDMLAKLNLSFAHMLVARPAGRSQLLH